MVTVYSSCRLTVKKGEAGSPDNCQLKTHLLIIYVCVVNNLATPPTSTKFPSEDADEQHRAAIS